MLEPARNFGQFCIIQLVAFSHRRVAHDSYTMLAAVVDNTLLSLHDMQLYLVDRRCWSASFPQPLEVLHTEI